MEHLFSWRLREVWWQYSQLEWAQINSQEQLVVKEYKHQALVITGSQQFGTKLIIYLKNLPDYEIHVLTFTEMGEILRSLASYENIKLHPTVMRWMCKKMIEECDVY